MDPESARVRAGVEGGDVDPLLNMAPGIGTNRANARPASFAAIARPNCAACVARATRMMQSPVAAG